MPSNLERRIDRLEQAGGERRLMVICGERGETTEQAIADHLAEHPQDAACDFCVVITGVPRSTAA